MLLFCLCTLCWSIFCVFFYAYAYSGVWICVPVPFTYSAATAERLQTIPPHSFFIFELQENTEMIIWQHCGKLNAFLIWCLQTILTHSFALLSKISFEDSFYPPELQKKKNTDLQKWQVILDESAEQKIEAQ